MLKYENSKVQMVLHTYQVHHRRIRIQLDIIQFLWLIIASVKRQNSIKNTRLRCTFVCILFLKLTHIQINNQMSSAKLTFQKGNVVIIDERFHLQIQLFIKLDYNVEQIDELSQLLFRQDIIEIHHAIIGLRKIISSDHPPVNQYMRGNIIPRIVELARQNQYPHVQHEAVWILTNIASCQTQYVKAIVQLGVISIFVGLLHSTNDELVDEAIWGLGNICGDSSQFRDEVIKCGLPAMFQCLRSSFKKNKLHIIFKNACWALGNIIRVRPHPPYQTVKESCLLFLDILENDAIADQSVFHQILWSISYSCVEQEISSRILNSLLVQKLVSNLRSAQKRTLNSTLAIFINLISGQSSNFKIIISKQPIFLQNIMEILQRFRSNSILSKVAKLFEVICLKDQQNIEIFVDYQPLYAEPITIQQPQYIRVYKNIVMYGNLLSVETFLIRVDIHQVIMNELAIGDQDDIFPSLQCLQSLLFMHYRQIRSGAITDAIQNILKGKYNLLQRLQNILLWQNEQLAGTILRVKQIMDKIMVEE